MKTKNQTNTKRIELLEKQMKETWKILDALTPWNFEMPVFQKWRKVPMSPEFPDMGYFFEPYTEPEKALKDRVKEG